MPPASSQDVALDNTNITVTSPVHRLIFVKIAALEINSVDLGAEERGRMRRWR
jgi:hypothetical protein